MMSVNDLDYEVATAADQRANALRHWIGLITALVDAVTVATVVAGTSLAYHFVAYRHLGNDKITVELQLRDLPANGTRRSTFQAASTWFTFVNAPPEDLLDRTFDEAIDDLLPPPAGG